MLSQGDLDRLSEANYRNKTIPGPTYCRHCGYNLQTLPYIHQCPECGATYDARPARMDGIFLPQLLIFPFVDVIVGLVSIAMAILAIAAAGVGAGSRLLLVLGIVYTLTALVLSGRAVHRVGKYLDARSILRRIERDESSE